LRSEPARAARGSVAFRRTGVGFLNRPKTRTGARVQKTYDTAQTPYQRLLTHPDALDETDAGQLAAQLDTTTQQLPDAKSVSSAPPCWSASAARPSPPEPKPPQAIQDQDQQTPAGQPAALVRTTYRRAPPPAGLVRPTPMLIAPLADQTRRDIVRRAIDRHIAAVVPRRWRATSPKRPTPMPRRRSPDGAPVRSQLGYQPKRQQGKRP
jgi:hypothetical protein